MHTRSRRFVAAALSAVGANVNEASTALKTAKWQIRKTVHPIEDYPVAVGYPTRIPVSFHGAVPGPALRFATPRITAVRHGSTTADIEVSFGLDLYYDRDRDHWGDVLAPSHTGSRLYSPPEIAQAQRGTADVRVKWDLGTGITDPDVKAFRVIPIPGPQMSQLLFFDKEIPINVAEGTSPVRDESALSGRATTFGAGSEMVIAVPWMHRDREVVFEIDLEHVHTVVSELKALVAPPPAPSE